jgi:type IV pilus assembly protein PilP
VSVRWFAIVTSGLLGLTLACGGDEPKPAAAPKKANTAPAAQAKSRKDKEVVEEKEAPRAQALLPIDFNDAARTRDPFLSFAQEFAKEAKKRVHSQRDVVLSDYSLDDLKLVGLVTGIRPARAMLLDPGKTGHVIHEGQFVGRAEVVQSGTSGTDYEINWRVDRIRDADVVLVREDPANPDVPTATRVILLRPDEAIALR